MEFQQIDFTRVRLWTLAEIARFNNLTSIQFIGCKYPKEFNESLLIRTISNSFNVLEKLAITDNDLVCFFKLEFKKVFVDKELFLKKKSYFWDTAIKKKLFVENF